MSNRRVNNQVFGALMNVIIGVGAWVALAAVLAWMLSSEYIGDESVLLAVSIGQSVIGLVMTVHTCRGLKGNGGLRLLTPLAFLLVQTVISLLLWGIDLNGMMRSIVSFVCGGAVGLLCCRLKIKRKRSRAFVGYR